MASSPRQTTWPFYLGLLLVLAALPVGYLFFLSRPAGTPAPAVAAVSAARPRWAQLTLTDVQGNVEVRLGRGEWQKAKVGTSLQRADDVRTQDGSSAVLQSANTYRIRLEPHTEVSVDELTQSLSRLLLESGMASADVEGASSHTFEVKAAHSDAVARSRGGSFSMTSNGSGTVAVGAQAGEIELQGRGKTVIVHAGEESLVDPGQAPSMPARAPNSLLLKVRWPEGSILKTKTAVLEGQTRPGAVVVVSGERAQVDRTGRFQVRLTLREGTNLVQVKAHSPSQRIEQAQENIEVDTRAPSMKLDPHLWDTHRK